MCELSIIVPIYNVEKYLGKCINSILEQTYENFELILVNDGSTDNCKKICENYRNIDSRIKVINKNNGGLSSARNAGIDIAKGQYIGFVDSDDWINKDMYREMMLIAKESDVEIVKCRFKKVYDEEEDKSVANKSLVNIIDKYEALSSLIKIGDDHVEYVVTWNKIYKRDLFDTIRFPEGKIHEDEFTTYKLFYKSKKIAVINEQLYYYRQRPDSIMSKKFTIDRLNYLEAIHSMLDFFKTKNENKLYDISVIRYINSLMQYYFICSQVISDNKEILKQIKSNHAMYLKDFIFCNLTGLREKIIEILFYTSPNMYKNLKLKRDYIIKVTKRLNI